MVMTNMDFKKFLETPHCFYHKKSGAVGLLGYLSLRQKNLVFCTVNPQNQSDTHMLEEFDLKYDEDAGVLDAGEILFGPLAMFIGEFSDAQAVENEHKIWIDNLKKKGKEQELREFLADSLF